MCLCVYTDRWIEEKGRSSATRSWTKQSQPGTPDLVLGARKKKAIERGVGGGRGGVIPQGRTTVKGREKEGCGGYRV